MERKAKIDMTTGPIMKSVFFFALPICLGNILQQLYNTVDTLIIGNFCGALSLAAIGTSAQPVEMLLCIFMGLGTGVSILVSQYVGSKDMEQLNDAVATAISFLYICAIPVSVLGLFLGPVILDIMQVPADTRAYAVMYIRILFLGTLGNMGYNLNAGILRGLGDSRSTLNFLFISCGVNIGLDLLFIAVFHMDVAGAALATVIAIFSSWAFSIFYIRKKYPELQFTFLPKRLSKPMLSRIIAVGLPLGLNNSIYSVGHIFMQAFINMQGSVFMAACAVATKLTGIANIAITSFSSAASTFAGQNYGAQNYKRLRKGSLLIPLCSGFVTCIAGLTFTYFCRPVLSIFNDDVAVIDMAVHYIRIVLPFTWVYAIFTGIINYVNGIGEVKYPTIVNILTLWAVRIPCAYIIATFFDGTYVMASIPVSFVFGMCSMLIFYLTPKWKRIYQ